MSYEHDSALWDVCVFLGEGAGEGGVSVARSLEKRTIFSESLKPRVFCPL